MRSNIMLKEQFNIPAAETLPAVQQSGSSEMAWRALGWFGLLLAFVGLADLLLTWVPLAFGNPGWEFATVDQSFGSLPLVTMGLAAVLASSLAIGSRWRVRLVAGFLLLFAVALLTAYVTLYALNIPLALQMAPAEVSLGLKKAIVKTTVMAVAFPGAYVVASVLSILSLRGK
jgi:hypothetical protein